MNKSISVRQAGMWACAVIIWILAAIIANDSSVAALIMVVASGVFVPPIREDLINYGANGNYLSAVAVIVVVICFMQGFMANPDIQSQVAERSAEREKQEVEERAAKEVVRNTDNAMLAMRCENAIKPQLKNPKSFDIDMHQTQLYDNDGTLVLDMFYYAENSYGATSINEAFCEFTTSGTLIKVLPVP